jgi:hypothetical protein
MATTRIRDRLASKSRTITALGWLVSAIATLFPVARLGAAEAVAAPVHRLGDLSITSTAGEPAAMGAALGAAFRTEIPPLLGLMGLRTIGLKIFARAKLKRLLAAIPERYRAEITAMAQTSGVEAEQLLAANALVDTQCSALIAPASADRPQRIARNMDFFPADALGHGTVLIRFAPVGRHALVSVGWPGTAGVVSGINDVGLTACILLNHAGCDRPGGEPILLRIRTLLETCTTVDEAVAAFAASPVASGHYVLLADGATAAVTWQEPDGPRRHDPAAGWLACSNGVRGDDGRAADERGTTLQGLIGHGEPDPAWMRQSLTSTYLKGINAQAMVFTPATRTLELALGSASAPAALQTWRRIELAGLLAGAGPATVPVSDLPKSQPLTHFLDQRPKFHKVR